MRLASLFDAEEVQLFYQIAVHGRNDLGLAPDEYAGFSMTLLRMLAFRPVDGDDAPRLAPPKKSALAAVPVIAAASVPTSVSTSVSASASASVSASAPAPAARLNVAPTTATQSIAVARPMSPGRAALDAARGIMRPSSGAAAAVPAVPAPRVMAPFVPTAPVVQYAEITPANPAVSVAQPEAEPDFTDSGMPPLGEFAESSTPATLPLHHKSKAATAASRNAMPAPTDALNLAAIATVIPIPIPAPIPVPALNWDGDWPVLATELPLRGVIQQLALQAELVSCTSSDGIELRLRVPLETLASPGNIDKLAAALTAHFAQPVRVAVDIGNVLHTANTKAEAARALRQREAELQIQSDPFVLGMMREFGATIVPGSIKPN